MRLAISDFNHELIARYGGAYYFWPLYPRTPFGWHKYILANGPIYDHSHTRRQRKAYWRGSTQGYPRAVVTARAAGRLPERLFMHGLSSFSIGPSQIEERLADALSRAWHFAVGETYARHFDSWVPIDLERPAAAEESVIGRVFNAIGVDGGYDHLAFHSSEGTTVHRLMVQNWIAVEVFGHLLHLGLGYANRTMFSNTFPHSEMLPFNPDDRFLDLGFGRQPLCVTVERAQWRLLPRDIRIRLVEFGGDSEISQRRPRSGLARQLHTLEVDHGKIPRTRPRAGSPNTTTRRDRSGLGALPQTSPSVRKEMAVDTRSCRSLTVRFQSASARP